MIRAFPPLLGVLAFAAPALAQAQTSPIPERVLRAYDVHDLIRAPAKAAAPAKATPKPQGNGARKDWKLVKDLPLLGALFGKNIKPEDLTATKKAAKLERDTEQVDGLVRLIRAFCQPALTHDDIVSAVGTKGIVARAPQAAQEWIARFLEVQRKRRTTLLYLEFKLLTMPQAQFDALVAPVLRVAPARARDAGSEHALLVPSKDTAKFLESLDAAPQTDILMLPRVVLNNSTSVKLESIKQISYIKDFNIEISKDGKSATADPVVDVVEDGVRFAGNAAILPSARIGLDFELSISNVKRPIEQMQTKLAIEGAAPVTIQLPELTVSRLRASFECSSKDYAVFGMPELGDKRGVLVARLRTIEAADK